MFNIAENVLLYTYVYKIKIAGSTLLIILSTLYKRY